jgi:hypothetical protein
MRRNVSLADLQDDALIDCPASKVAFAVLFCARSAFEFVPVWSEALRAFTGHAQESFAFCVSRLRVAACHVAFASPPLSKRKKLRDHGYENRFKAEGRSFFSSMDDYGTPSTSSPVFEPFYSSEKRQQYIALSKAIVSASKRNKKRLAAPQL